MRKTHVKVLVEILVDGAGNPGRLSGVRVRCAVPGNVDQVVEVCVGAVNSLVALVVWNVNAKIVANVAAAVLVRAAALDLACHNF